VVRFGSECGFCIEFSHDGYRPNEWYLCRLNVWEHARSHACGIGNHVNTLALSTPYPRPQIAGFSLGSAFAKVRKYDTQPMDDYAIYIFSVPKRVLVLENPILPLTRFTASSDRKLRSHAIPEYHIFDGGCGLQTRVRTYHILKEWKVEI